MSKKLKKKNDDTLISWGDPDDEHMDLKGYWREVRDIVLSVVAIFMLVYETILAAHVEPLIVGAALVLLGLPATLRLDEKRQSKNGD